MQEELFVASVADKTVKALGMRVECALNELHIYINGQDITKTIVLEEVRIVKETKKGE
jgi:hypothetical protein